MLKEIDMEEIKVAIIDDHPLVLNGLQNLLRYDATIRVTGVYHTGSELLRDFARQQPDVLLLDIHMAEQTGDELAEVILKTYPSVRILVLSNLDNVYYVRNMFQLGVSGYLSKTSHEDRIIEALKSVYKGGHYLDPGIELKMLEQDSYAAEQRNKQLILTRREKEVLQLIAANNTSQEIAQKLFLSKRTVDTHRNSLLLKLGVKNSAGLVKKAIDIGLIR